MSASAPPSAVPAPMAVDAIAARRAFARAACSARFDPADDVLAREIERRMAERLELVRLQPARVLDAGAGAGAGLALLGARYPQAELIALDSALPLLARIAVDRSMFARARGWFGAAPRGVARMCADLGALPLSGASVQMVWSNLALNWAASLPAAIGEWHRVLAVEGMVMFSCYGPDTLRELREASARALGTARTHSFVDMHDIGDMLVAAGFAEPVMDVERLTLTYPSLAELARDLRASGQTNVLAARARGLLTPRAWGRVAVEYERARSAGRLPATIEIIYGHAWKPAPRTVPDGRAIITFERASRPAKRT